MGFLVYDTTREIAVEDRVLAHLQVVIIDKLRRAENFGLNLRSENRIVMMWVTRSARLKFVYEGNRRPPINAAWVELMASEAGLTGTLQLLHEPVELLAPVPSHALEGATP
jgi:hypothetical protein